MRWLRKLFGLDFPDPEVGQVWRSSHSQRRIRIAEVDVDDHGDTSVYIQHEAPAMRSGWTGPATIYAYDLSEWRRNLRAEGRVLEIPQHPDCDGKDTLGCWNVRCQLDGKCAKANESAARAGGESAEGKAWWPPEPGEIYWVPESDAGAAGVESASGAPMAAATARPSEPVGGGCVMHGLAHPCEACAAEVPFRQFLEYWTHEGHLQTFEDRQRFRTAAHDLLGVDPVTDGAQMRAFAKQLRELGAYRPELVDGEGTFNDQQEKTR